MEKRQKYDQQEEDEIERLLKTDRFQNLKNKNALTIPQLTEAQVGFFRYQEAERYK